MGGVEGFGDWDGSSTVIKTFIDEHGQRNKVELSEDYILKVLQCTKMPIQGFYQSKDRKTILHLKKLKGHPFVDVFRLRGEKYKFQKIVHETVQNIFDGQKTETSVILENESHQIKAKADDKLGIFHNHEGFFHSKIYFKPTADITEYLKKTEDFRKWLEPQRTFDLKQLSPERIALLENKMRPNGLSQEKYLGESESLMSIVESDRKELNKLNLTPQELAEPLMMFKYLHQYSHDLPSQGEFRVGDTYYFFDDESYMGPSLPNPFEEIDKEVGKIYNPYSSIDIIKLGKNPGVSETKEFQSWYSSVRRRHNSPIITDGKYPSIRFFPMLPEMIYRLGFFGGKDTKFRPTEPKALYEFFSDYFEKQKTMDQSIP